MLWEREEGWKKDEQMGHKKTISKDKKQTYFTITDRLSEMFSQNWMWYVYSNLKQAEGYGYNELDAHSI